jgi:N-acetylglucosaminyldiphosphoundecaprenol N-acetyl-beta-D-mannosaminyltransferase
MPAESLPTVRLLGLDFADLEPQEAAARLLARPASAPFAYVVTPNADHLVRLAREPALRPLYENALMRLMDSRVVARAARAMGLPSPRVTTGSHLTALLVDHMAKDEKVTLVGPDPVHLDAFAARTGLTDIAHYNPPMGFDRDPAAMAAAVRFVLAHPARFVFLAVGSPRQERLAAEIAAAGSATGTGLCIGASLDFLAGAVKRAPGWVQRAGLEWLHRLASDPRRLARRYLRDNPPIFALLLRERQNRKS